LATLAAPGVSATARSRADVTDHDLVQAVRAGDDHAFERLYHRYHRRISAYIFGMVHDHGRAEDLTQEVFVSALRRIRQTDRPIAFKPWIYEIAKNACIDAFRRTRRAEEVSYDAEEGLGANDHGRLAATGPSPDAAVDTKQRLENLCGAFGGLSDAHHQILVMRELEGLSYREIGERLGMSRPSVESTLFRARRRLTEEYEELVTGERCLRIQAIIASAGAGTLGMRDQRRVGSHISHCQPCRRHARIAGLDAAAMARRPVRAKLAALLPLPAFLKRRWLPGGGDGAAAAATHGSSLTHWSLAATQFSEPTMGGWVKAAAVATAVAVAGVGAGTAVEGQGTSKHDPPAVTSGSAPAHGRSSAPGGSGAAQAGGGSAATGHHAGTLTRTAQRGGAGTTAGGAAGGATNGASQTAAGGAPASGGPSGSADHGSTPIQDTSLSNVAPGAPGTGGGSPPLVQPDPAQITQPSSPGGQAPSTAGDAVKGTTGAAGATAGGAVGDAVKGAGAGASSTVVQPAADAVKGTAGAATGAVTGSAPNAAASAPSVPGVVTNAPAVVGGAVKAAGTAAGGAAPPAAPAVSQAASTASGIPGAP
jgi:RNA polymerase sigma factor (sigma-70 family)